MSNLNKVMIIGRIGQDPEIKYSKLETPIANFSVATNSKWNKNGEQEKTEWHKVILFGKQAEICGKYASKGNLVYVEGRLQTRTYEKDNVKHYVTEIIGYLFFLLESKKNNQKETGNKDNKHQQSDNSYNEDDIPF
jgi:single-strand DNA-binding protein